MAIELRLPVLQIPHLCHGRFLFRAIVLTQAVAVVLAFSPGAHNDPWSRLGVISLFVHWVVLLTIINFCWLRRRLNALKPLYMLGACISVFEVATVFVSVSAYYWLTSQSLHMPQTLAAFVLANMMIALILAVLATLFFIIHTERNQQIQAQSQAELTALQARIEPHFLFNSLNTVAELTQIDANAAEQALINLSSLFRAALNAGQVVSLTDELKLSKGYLSLEQWRLGDRMQVVWDIPAQLPDVLLPALTIQPLLENAVRHGIEPNTEQSQLSIAMLETRYAISIVITNPLCLNSRSSGNGIALNNIRQRLQLHFGNAAQLHCAVNGDTYRIKLVLPKRDAK
ncbi:sensor histidine kinase [Rheinheimera baltica]|uniref:sensor histidine kinase n=1 Tax=Rheinheimera baltica TaxID=67576 RepID=UPI00273D8A1E|nr:histidine kinase [Rheinheimera baltica]MDP5150064.1 histidine kinase [Rheinheimera baltica]